MAIIFALGPVSGAHLNPAVTLVDWLCGGVRWPVGLLYCAAQLVGGAVGALVANVMFGLPALELSSKPRWGAGLWIGEVVATFGLVLVIFSLVRARRASVAPLVVGAYITAAYWFTSSTSFANPAVTLARTLSDTFAGIAPGSVLPFLAAQLAGALVAAGAVLVLHPNVREVADQVVLPHEAEAAG